MAEEDPAVKKARAHAKSAQGGLSARVGRGRSGASRGVERDDDYERIALAARENARVARGRRDAVQLALCGAQWSDWSGRTQRRGDEGQRNWHGGGGTQTQTADDRDRRVQRSEMPRFSFSFATKYDTATPLRALHAHTETGSHVALSAPTVRSPLRVRSLRVHLWLRSRAPLALINRSAISRRHSRHPRGPSPRSTAQTMHAIIMYLARRSRHHLRAHRFRMKAKMLKYTRDLHLLLLDSACN